MSIKPFYMELSELRDIDVEEVINKALEAGASDGYEGLEYFYDIGKYYRYCGVDWEGDIGFYDDDMSYSDSLSHTVNEATLITMDQLDAHLG